MNTKVIILAAGEGKRMGGGLPKVMRELKGGPLINYVVCSVERAGFFPIVVVSSGHSLVQDYLGGRADYAVQHYQLGTGHAVSCAEEKLRGAKSVVVLNGDMPFISEDSINKLIEKRKKEKAAIVVATVTAKDFEGGRQYLRDFGRIVRNEKGEVIKITEVKDAEAKELGIKEVNSGFYCFDAGWLWKNLKELKNNNAQGEYYLTDLINLASRQGKKISSISIDAKEAVGINTKEHLDNANNL